MNVLAENAPPVTAIVAIVADAFGYSPDDLVGDRRFKDLARARQIASYIAAGPIGHSLIHAGFWLRIDNSTVWHARREIARAMVTDTDLAARVAAIVERCQNWREEIQVLCRPRAPREAPDTSWIDEAQRLHAIGWSVSGLARRLARPARDVADVVGVEWQCEHEGCV